MPEISPTKYLVNIGWDDVPHLAESEKERMLSGTMPHLRDARSKGIPALGSGAIYPVEESEIICEPFEIPSHWPICYGMDVGWKKTGVLWSAWDRTSDVIYVWSEHYRGQAEPSIHADAIRARAEWIPGVIDPAARGRSQIDGNILLENYIDLGLNLTKANNAVEAGLQKVWQRLSTGRLKIFRVLQNTLAEYRLYRRDERGKIVKENDHLMDCLRYLVMSGLDVACTQPFDTMHLPGREDGRDKLTGY